MKPKILPPVYFLFYLLAAGALTKLMPIAWIVPESLRMLGIAPLAAGFLVIVWAAALFRKKGTPVKPFEPSTTLVMEGPYTFTRNPMYLGMLVMLTGVAVLLGNLAALLSPVAMFLTLQSQYIPAEERMMTQAFGQNYRDFQQRVRRWI